MSGAQYQAQAKAFREITRAKSILFFNGWIQTRKKSPGNKDQAFWSGEASAYATVITSTWEADPTWPVTELQAMILTAIF
jgi:hypothetical protein